MSMIDLRKDGVVAGASVEIFPTQTISLVAARTELGPVQRRSPFRKRYRIVTDKYRGFEAQNRSWWCPFWTQMSGHRHGVNTHASVEDAEKFISQQVKTKLASMQQLVKYVEPDSV